MPSPTITEEMIESARSNFGSRGIRDRFIFFDDFFTAGYNGEASSAKFSETADDCQWNVTKVDAATDNGETIVISDAEVGGVLALTTNDADNDALNIQLNGEAFAVTANKRIDFEARFKVTDVSEADWFIGLASTSTGQLVLAGVNDSIGFQCPDSTGDIDTVLEDDTSDTGADSTKDLADDTFVTCRFEINGTSSVTFWIDGVFISTATTGLIDAGAALTPSIEIRNDGAAANTIEVDYIMVAQDR